MLCERRVSSPRSSSRLPRRSALRADTHGLERLPGPRREALSVAFGLGPGQAADHFMVSVAALGLLRRVANERPLVCLIDDAQLLGLASAQALAFVAAPPVGGTSRNGVLGA